MSLYKSLLAISLLLSILVGCGAPQATYSNFLKVQKGMTPEEVIDILGEPTDVTAVSADMGFGAIFGLGDLGGTNMVWKGNNGKANVIFINNKVKSSNFTNQF
jgi:hypothetical protein